MLVIGAHNDDPLDGAGGLIALLSQKGWDVRFIITTYRRTYSEKIVSKEVLEQYNKPETRAEYDRQDQAAAAVLGAENEYLNKKEITFCHYTVEDAIELRDRIDDFCPDITLIQWPKDNHYEHVETAKLAMQALSYSGVSCEVYAYENGPWHIRIYFIPDFFINVTSAVDKIKESFLCYNQISISPVYHTKETLIKREYRGHMAGYPYGEAFKILRFPCKDDPEMLLPKLFGRDFKWGGGRQYMWGRSISVFIIQKINLSIGRNGHNNERK